MPQTPTDRARQLETILRHVDRLPTLSPVAARLLEITDVDDADLDEIIALIETDVALSATILKLVRSAERGLGDRITSIHQAVVLLGLDSIRSAVLSVEILDMFQQPSEADEFARQTGFDNHGFWKHAIAVACAAELLARERTDAKVDPQMAFLAGLLHGLGQLVLHMVLPQAYDRALDLAEQKHSPGSVVERAILGIDHHTAGRRLADRWGLPPWIRDVIWFHSQPLEGIPVTADRDLIATVTLARVWCQKHHLGWSGDFNLPPAIEPLAEDLGISMRRMLELVDILLERIVERETILGLQVETKPEALIHAIARANKRLGALNSALELEVRASRGHRLVARQVALFLDRWKPECSLESTIECIGRSMLEVFSLKNASIAWRAEVDNSWHLMHLIAEGSEILTHTHATPSSDDRLSPLLGSSGSTGISVSVVPWLEEQIIDRSEGEDLRLFPVCVEQALEVVAVHSADVSTWNARTQLGVILAVWQSAAQMACTLDRAHGLEDSLAAANRVLAETQAELAQRDSLARLGEMTAGAAHEMNNPLAVIRGRAQMLRTELADTELASYAGAIVEAASDLSDLIAELNQLACLEGPNLQISDMSQIVSKAMERASQRGVDPTVLHTHLDQAPGSVTTDRELLSLALSELVINALESGSSTNPTLDVHLGAKDGRLYLRVRDHGRGLSSHAQRHAFDPFFSEKPAGRQRGLGLSRARRCVELLGGSICIEPNEGGGTIATISLSAQQVLASAA